MDHTLGFQFVLDILFSDAIKVKKDAFRLIESIVGLSSNTYAS
jgi:hypothetical protein